MTSANEPEPTTPIPISGARPGGSLVGTRLGGYQVLRQLGSGGMSEVYAARDLTLDRDVALKVLRSDLANDKSYIERFRREARAAARLNHSNIVQVYEVGNVDKTHYIAQELIEGRNLREHLQSVGQIDPAQAVEILLAVASALEVATEVGITHRDIKPENVMISQRGAIKVADFGLARLNMDSDTSNAGLTQAGFALGTPRYMSPEQVQGMPVDSRSDLYSLGVTMYHLLAGRPPFDSDDPMALAYAHLNETPKPLDRARGNDDVPEWLVAIVARLILKDPNKRFQSPTELLNTLRGDTQSVSYNVGTSSATVHLQRAAEEARKRERRKLARRATAVLAPLLALIAGIAISWPQGGDKVANMLRPAKVTRGETVERQFVIAVERDDEAGWLAVSEYFPPDENPVHREYATKASLQLAALYATQEDFAAADRILQRIHSDAQVDRRYRLVALAKHVGVLGKLSDPMRLAAVKREFVAMYQELESSNSPVIEWFRRVVPEEDRPVVDSVSLADPAT
ncbi:protein kinase domain-containing protein [Stieleria varia]|uniref:non-specific serine/threonine protein kinase n=1 Tax=Stieleria varia TaxID=2528005 RepID=A0A5C6AQX4_9BACT|nr:protein kinase [Stieleria varia]TWU02443.1 Serine/threonine-protein kinase PknB [Stieleria varia]